MFIVIVVYCQTLPATRLCLFKEDFVDHSENMKTWFSKWGYPDKIIGNKVKKVNFSESRSKTKSATGVPVVVTYHPIFKALGKITHETFNLLYMNDEVKDTFTPGPIASFRTCKCRKWKSRKSSKKQYEVCENVQNSDTFRGSVTSKTFKTNHWLNYDELLWLVYLVTCKTCSKHYTRVTNHQFMLRWNNYKSNEWKFKRGEHCIQEHLYENIYSDGHNGFLQDVAITPID